VSTQKHETFEEKVHHSRKKKEESKKGGRSRGKNENHVGRVFLFGVFLLAKDERKVTKVRRGK